MGTAVFVYHSSVYLCLYICMNVYVLFVHLGLCKCGYDTYLEAENNLMCQSSSSILFEIGTVCYFSTACVKVDELQD